jgi:acyl transferase domain-containing protein
MDPVAIIGAQLRLPGADSLEAFWAKVLHTAASPAAAADGDHGDGATALLDGPARLAWPGTTGRIDLFDHSLFGYTREQAASIDPQQRILLVLAYRLLEQIGVTSDSVGIFTSIGFPYYLLRCLAVSPPLRTPAAELVADNNPDCTAPRIAYALGLHGPAMSIQAGNASALLAVHMARMAILTGQCQVALVGAASLRLAPRRSDTAAQAIANAMRQILNAAQADDAPLESLPASGAVIVALKSVHAAMRDGNEILGLIRSSAINHDGRRKRSFAEPSYDGYSEVIRRACEGSGTAPDTIGYVEAHGTGLACGDAIETAALKAVLDAWTTRHHYCAFNSTRPDVGQLGVVSGLASLLKAALCIKHAIKAPFNGARAAELEALFAQSPFYVSTVATDWTAEPGHPRRAAVSAFDIGCNAHLIIEEAAPRELAHGVDTGPLLLSAHNARALHQLEQDMRASVTRDPQRRGDLRYTTQLQRRHDDHRMALVFAGDTAHAPGASPSLRSIRSTYDWSQARVGLIFDGRHPLYAGIGRALHARGGHFRATFDDCAAQFAARGWPDPRKLLADTEALVADAAPHHHFLFSLQYALGALFSAAGLPVSAAFTADANSEYAAAALAGVFSQQDAIQLMCERAKLARRRQRNAGAASASALAPSPGDYADESLRAALEDCMPRAPYFRLVAADGHDDAGAYATLDYWLDNTRRGSLAEPADPNHSLHGCDVLIEIGPGAPESAAQPAHNANAVRFATLLPGEETVLVDTVLSQCWANRMPIEWQALYGITRGNVVPLPPHPFDESSCWYE